MTRVLVVDDDFVVAKVHSRFIEGVPGFTVVGVAHTGAGALAAVAALQPDLVLLDIYLPDISGLEVLRRLRDGASPVDVLAISAARDIDTICGALRCGIVHYMIKPFPFEALRERLQHYLTTRNMLAAKEEAAQEDVDRLFGGTVRPRGPIPKGLTRTTAQLVTRVLSGCEADMSAIECAAQAGLSRASTRRYLDYLVQCGKAEVRMRYGGVGRPEHRYRLTA